MKWDPSYKHRGNSPWGGDKSPVGVWAWNEEKDEVIIGFDQNELDAVSYDEARQIFQDETIASRVASRFLA